MKGALFSHNFGFFNWKQSHFALASSVATLIKGRSSYGNVFPFTIAEKLLRGSFFARTFCKVKCKACIWGRWPNRPKLIPVSVAWSSWEYFYSPLDGMLVHRRVTLSIKFAGTHLYTWEERATVRVKCLAQEDNTISPTRARTRTPRSGVERTNHEATAPPTQTFCTAPQTILDRKWPSDRKWSGTANDHRCGPQMIPPENEEWHGVCSSCQGFKF